VTYQQRFTYMSNVAKGLILVGTLLGFVPSALTWGFYLQRLHELERYHETTGVVVGITSRSFNASAKPIGNRPVSLDVPVVEYETPAGPQRGNPIHFSSGQPFSLNGSVVVFYNPEKPSAFVLSARSIPPTLPTIITLITLVVAALVFRVFKARQVAGS